MTQFTCKGVKQINNQISLNMTFTFTIHISRRFSSAQEFQMGNFQKYWSQNVGQDFLVLDFFSRAEDFESWREGQKGPSKLGEKCSRWKVHMYQYTSPWAEFELTTSIVIGSVQVLIAQMVVNLITMRSCLRYPPLTWRCVQLILQVRTSIGTYQCLVVFSMYSIFIWHLNWLSWYICRKNYLKANKANIQ